jgi:polyisoprenoid-binding protein YceI
VPRYVIVPERSQVWIDARSSLHPINTRTDGLEGYLEFEADGGGRIDLDAECPRARLSLPVDRLQSGNALEDRELRRRIDARRFPTIVGELTAMKAVGADSRYLVTGDLTVRGVTRSYEDEMEFAFLDDGTIRAGGRSTFDVRDFGMEPPRILMFKVEPEVQVRVEIIARKESNDHA